jgi:hypothetical protein
MQKPPVQPQRVNTVQEPLETNIDDTIARKELKNKFGELNRSERVKNVFNWAFIIFIIIVSAIVIITVAVRLLHLALPVHRHWLSAEQIQSIDKLFLSGTVGGLLVNYVKKINGQT